MTSEAKATPTQRVFLRRRRPQPRAEGRAALRLPSRTRDRSGVAMLYVTEPASAEWLGVGEIMREERRAEAETRLQELASEVREMSGDLPVLYVREGDAAGELLKLLDEEPSVSVLVLGADPGPKGPGPLITTLANKHIGKLRVPLTIVPGALSIEAINSVT